MITIMIGCKPDNLNQILSYHAVIVYSSQKKIKKILTLFKHSFILSFISMKENHSVKNHFYRTFKRSNLR